jgi:hypothetical protein
MSKSDENRKCFETATPKIAHENLNSYGGKIMFKTLNILLILLICSVNSAGDTRWEWHNPLPQGCNLSSLWGASPNDIFAVGDNGAILHYDGSAWSSMVSATQSDYPVRSILW